MRKNIISSLFLLVAAFAWYISDTYYNYHDGIVNNISIYSLPEETRKFIKESDAIINNIFTFSMTIILSFYIPLLFYSLTTLPDKISRDRDALYSIRCIAVCYIISKYIEKIIENQKNDMNHSIDIQIFQYAKYLNQHIHSGITVASATKPSLIPLLNTANLSIQSFNNMVTNGEQIRISCFTHLEICHMFLTEEHNNENVPTNIVRYWDIKSVRKEYKSYIDEVKYVELEMLHNVRA